MTVENLNISVKTNADKAAAKLLTLGSALEKVQGSAVSVGGNAGARAAKGVEQVGKAAEKANKPMNNFLASLKRIAFYRIIRGIIKSITQAFQEGLEKAYLFSAGVSGEGNRFAAALDRMKSAGNQMKGQLGSAFIALLTAVEPVLIALINLVTKAADAISQFLSAFTGKTYLKANATAAKFADTMARGGAAAKEWKNQLLGFDEINRLNEPNQGGGGSAANPLEGYSFEDAPINDKILNFVNDIKEKLEPALERLKGAFERLKEAWGRFTESLGNNGTLKQFTEDLIALGGNAIINGLTVLSDTLTLILNVLTALNTGDWSPVWVSLKQLIYDVVVAVSDLAVGLTNLLYDALIGIMKPIDNLMGTDFAGWLQANKDAFNEMYNASKESTNGLFGLKRELGLTDQSLKDAAVESEKFETALVGVGTQSDTAENEVRGIRTAIDWVREGFRDFGTEVGYILSSMFSPLANLASWLDGILQRFGILNGINARVNQMNADGSIYLQGFASGGFPTEGQLFLANEGSAPEMVGTMGGRTAVATNGDIVEGIRQGVYEAVSAANGGDKDVQVRVYLDSREIKAGQQRLNRAWGVG